MMNPSSAKINTSFTGLTPSSTKIASTTTVPIVPIPVKTA